MNRKLTFIAALLLLLAPASGVRAQQIVADLDAVASGTVRAFYSLAGRLEKSGQWAELQRVGHARRVRHPRESLAWDAEATGAYAAGDIDAAIAAYEGRLRLAPNETAQSRLDHLRAVRAKFPDLQLQPIQWVESDAALAQRPHAEKARELLDRKDYDALERVASELQRSGAADVKGYAFLQTFFNELSSSRGNKMSRQRAIEAWRAARPASDLARLVEIQFWLDRTFDERGNGYADSITPAMSARMDEALERATRGINQLPASANATPLLFVTLQGWAQLAGVGRPFMDAVFQEGAAKFPGYIPLYQSRINILLPRWYGAPGEWEAMVARQADAIGGIEGDKFYARLYGHAYVYSGSFGDEPEPPTPYDSARFWRGLSALRALYPDSIALRTIHIKAASDQGVLPATRGDFERFREVITQPNAHLIDGSFSDYGLPEVRREFGIRRMDLLATDTTRP